MTNGMTTLAEVRALTPSQCWDTFVGQQTVAEFVSSYPEGETLTAVCDYVRALPMMFGDEIEEDAEEELVDKLVEYIEETQK